MLEASKCTREFISSSVGRDLTIGLSPIRVQQKVSQESERIILIAIDKMVN
jgi:hypothetical protein